MERLHPKSVWIFFFDFLILGFVLVFIFGFFAFVYMAALLKGKWFIL